MRYDRQDRSGTSAIPQRSRDRQSNLAGRGNRLQSVRTRSLIIRYKGFPGARDIQRDLDKALKKVGLTEEELYAKTRELHAQGGVYQNLGRNREDWS